MKIMVFFKLLINDPIFLFINNVSNSHDGYDLHIINRSFSKVTQLIDSNEDNGRKERYTYVLLLLLLFYKSYSSQ